MNSAESTLDPRYWFGRVDTRPLAIFRILLGVTMLQDVCVRALDATTFFSDAGIYPRAWLPSGVASWGLFSLSGSPLYVGLWFLVGTLAALAFTLGYRTRWATLLSWLFFVSVHRRVPPIHTGGDTLLDITLFFGFFTELSGYWSLDARRRGCVPLTHALIPRLLLMLPAALYLETARAKLLDSGALWLNGPIIFQHLHLQGWVRPGGLLLREYPLLCGWMTGFTIVIELAIPLLIVAPFWVRPLRLLAIVLHVGLQLGILVTLKVGIFTNVMLAFTATWLLPEWLDRVPAAASSPAGSPPARPLSLNLGQGALAFVYVLALLAPVAGRHLPTRVQPLLAALGLDLKIGLFTKGYPSERWLARGELRDGRQIDPLAFAAPSADGGILNSQWMQLPYRLDRFEALASYVCVRTTSLRRWELEHRSRPPFAPGETPAPERVRSLLRHDCETGSAGPTPPPR